MPVQIDLPAPPKDSTAETASRRGRHFERLAAFLEAEGVAYVVVGDTRAYPERIASDVDLVVPPEALPGFAALLERFGRANGLRLVQALRHEANAYYYVLSTASPDGPESYLHVDVTADYHRDGIRLLDAERLLEGRVRHERLPGREGAFFVPAPAVAFLYYLLKRIDKQDLSPASAAYLENVWRLDADRARDLLAGVWPEPEAALLSEAAESGDWSTVRDEPGRFRSALRRRPSLRERTAEMGRRLDRMRRPTGMWIAFLGPDGCGKSSVIAGLLPRVAPAFRETTSFHFRPAFELDLTAMAKPSDDPQGAPPRPLPVAALKLGYYAWDFVAGFALRVWPHLVRSTFVVFDRYYDDLLVDPARYRQRGLRRLTRAIQRLVPRPDLVILLDAPVDVLRARKQEVPPEETARQRAGYRELVGALSEGRIVDASAPLDEVVENVARHVLEHLTERTARRLHLRDARRP